MTSSSADVRSLICQGRSLTCKRDWRYFKLSQQCKGRFQLNRSHRSRIWSSFATKTSSSSMLATYFSEKNRVERDLYSRHKFSKPKRSQLSKFKWKISLLLRFFAFNTTFKFYQDMSQQSNESYLSYHNPKIFVLFAKSALIMKSFGYTNIPTPSHPKLTIEHSTIIPVLQMHFYLLRARYSNSTSYRECNLDES